MTDTLFASFPIGLIAPGGPVPAGALGIEVTDPALAKRCDAGNLDPQHGPGARVGAPTAVEAALDAPLPAHGTPLVTIRPDCDAFGAMAVFAWRAAGRPVPDMMRARIARIAAMDRYHRGPWLGRRSLPTSVGELDDDWPGADLAALSALCFDSRHSPEDKAAGVLHWLVHGMVPEDHRHAPRGRDEALVASLADGSTKIRRHPSGRFAQIVSNSHGAVRMAYGLSDTVLATDPAAIFPCEAVGNKHTLARWDGTGMLEVCNVIARVEPGWGGQPGIIGSPQDRPSRLSQDDVAEIFAQELA